MLFKILFSSSSFHSTILASLWYFLTKCPFPLEGSSAGFEYEGTLDIQLLVF